MASLFENVIRPLLFRLDAERAHEMGLKTLELGLVKIGRVARQELAAAEEMIGPIERFGIRFKNPVGIAAGFDKNAKVVDPLARLGFGFVEVGTVTYGPQPGNPKPRLFRLPDDDALINRLGFNNEGAVKVAERLSESERRCVVGVNIGRNRDVSNEEAVENYLRAFDCIHPVADYIAVNVSSPNTPGLRELQVHDNLEVLISGLQKRNRELDRKPLLIKIAPDLREQEVDAIADLCLRHGVDGIIATNTTTSREGLKTTAVESYGAGGLSGRPLRARSTQIISRLFRATAGKVSIIGVGGIFDATDAMEKVAAGASLVQVYTGFVYGGPSFPQTLVCELARMIKERGFDGLDDAVGSEAGG